MTRSCILVLCLLQCFALNTCTGLTEAPRILVKEITVRIENASLGYPDSLVLLPGDLPSEHRRTLFQQLHHNVIDNSLTSLEDNDDVSKVVETVLRAAAPLLKAKNGTASTDEARPAPEKRETASSTLVYLVESGRQRRKSRKRRAARLVRSSYTKQWQDACDSCPSLAPQQPVIINIIKTGSGCGNDCSPKPNLCGHPHCDSHPPHHHPSLYHPHPPPPPHFHHYPPPPPPHFHHYPPPPMFHQQPAYHSPFPPAQPVNNSPKPVYQQPQQPARPQTAAPAAPATPVAQPAPSFGGSFSQSSASAQSSSFAWNG